MYYEHFGLNYPPFKITPDTQLFYSGGNRGLVLDALLYAIENGEGIIKVVGEVGSGKTMLCRMLEEKLSKQIEVVYLGNPRLPPDMVLQAIAIEMRLSISPQANHLQVMHALQTRLLEKHANNQQVVIFIEEAQGMPIETLEEIRLLSNLETARYKLLQIVLFGQPELETNLSVTHIRQLKERITHSFYLKALTQETIRDYLHFRMNAVGYRGPPVFSPAAIRVLAKLSKGLMRRINILADKALLAAFADNVYTIRPKHIRLAARDSGFISSRLSSIPMGGIGLLLIFALASGIFWWPSYRETVWVWMKHEANSLPLLTRSQTEEVIPSQTPPQPSKKIESSSKKVPRHEEEITIPELSPIEILLQRIQATQEWLATVNGQHYSIQVMQTKGDKTEDLQKFLLKPEIQPLLEDLYVYRVRRKGQIFWEMVYAEFANADSASAAIATLPRVLKNNKPFLRNIASLQVIRER